MLLLIVSRSLERIYRRIVYTEKMILCEFSEIYKRNAHRVSIKVSRNYAIMGLIFLFELPQIRLRIIKRFAGRRRVAALFSRKARSIARQSRFIITITQEQESLGVGN